MSRKAKCAILAGIMVGLAVGVGVGDYYLAGVFTPELVTDVCWATPSGTELCATVKILDVISETPWHPRDAELQPPVP